MLRDLRLAFRMLLQSKAWTAVVLLSLALGIGVNTTLFSAINGLLLKSISVDRPEELVRLRWLGENQMATSRSEYGSSAPVRGDRVRSTVSFLVYQELLAANETLTGLLACAPIRQVNVVEKGEAELASALVVSGNYFQVLGVPAHIGRTILDEDDKEGAVPVAVISHSYWVGRFGADEGILGKEILVNNTPITIVGVTPPDYAGMQRLGESAPEIHLPLVHEPQFSGRDRLQSGTNWWLQLVGRLKPGATAERVEGNLQGVFQEAARAGWDSYESGLSDAERAMSRNQGRTSVPELNVASASRGIYDARQDTSRLFRILGGVVLLVLLIVCANVANLLLSRAALRRKEISIRLSLGATRIRLIRQLLTESVLLSSMGAALGLVVAFWSRQLLPEGENSPLDWRVFAFTAGVGVLTGLLFGIVPALKATRWDLASAAKEDSRNVSHSKTLLGKSLLVVQVALSLTLLIGAGLFVRTLHNLRNVDVGFNTRDVLLVRIDAGVNRYEDQEVQRLFEQIQESFQAIPGVQAVSLSVIALLAGGTWMSDVYVGADESVDGLDAHIMSVSPEFFGTLDIPFRLGRNFNRQDKEGTPDVAIVNDSAARALFGSKSPVGLRFGFSPEARGDVEVVGVIADTKYSSIRDDAPPTVFRPYLQNPISSVTFELRTGVRAESIIPLVREAVRGVDRNLPIQDISTQADEVEERVADERFLAQAFSLFGGLALLLACIGLFGLMSYSVVRRTNEIGIRMAMGALPSGIVKMVLRESLTLVLIGCGIGLAAAFGAGRLVSTLLYGLAPTDFSSMVASIAVMLVVSVLAAYLPARRASRVDPMTALHYE